MAYEESTVGQLVVERPARSRVFERFGIDYCCGGRKPLVQACEEKGIDLDRVKLDLEEADREIAGDERDWAAAPMAELADHIESTHHAYLKSELPRLEFLCGKVAAVHGSNNPKLIELNSVFRVMKAEMDSHMAKEEQILFPLCRELESREPTKPSHCGSIRNPISVMVREHEDAGNALSRMRELTNGYVAPVDACNTYRAMFDALAKLESDMHQHVHKENNILFPRAILAEESQRA